MSFLRGMALGLMTLTMGCGKDAELPEGAIRATELHAQISADWKAAQTTFGGKELLVLGTIKEIDGGYRIELATDDPDSNITCNFSSTQQSPIERAAKGQQVVIRGKWDGRYRSTGVLLRGCSFYRQPVHRTKQAAPSEPEN